MNNAEIIKSLELSASAYRDIQPYSPHSRTTVIENKKAGVKCFLRREINTLRITFRGTETPREWLSNFKFCKKTIPFNNEKSKIKVHTGFLNSYKNPEVRDKILEAVEDDTYCVKISGHSRGAALAVLCAVDIQYNYPGRDIEVILFGCPRVGNKWFVQSFNRRVNKAVRIENSNDIVTKVPFAFMGYRHVGARLHVGNLRLPLRFSANDHYPHKYYSNLLGKIMF
jgi:predicted lipase